MCSLGTVCCLCLFPSLALHRFIHTLAWLKSRIMKQRMDWFYSDCRFYTESDHFSGIQQWVIFGGYPKLPSASQRDRSSVSGQGNVLLACYVLSPGFFASWGRARQSFSTSIKGWAACAGCFFLPDRSILKLFGTKSEDCRKWRW